MTERLVPIAFKPKTPGCIYRIESAATGRVYIGSTIRRPRQRWLEHLHALRKGKHFSSHLQRVFEKYGESDLSFSSVESFDSCEHRDLLAAEQRHIDTNASICLNSELVSESILAAHAANRGRKQPDEERARRSVSAKKATPTRKMRDWSPEARAAHSIALTGRKMPPMSIETREKIVRVKAFNRALRGDGIAHKFDRYAFIESEKPTWAALRAQGKSFREIERITGRSRGLIARECAR